MCKGPEAGGNLRVGNVNEDSVLGMGREKRRRYWMRLEKRESRGQVMQGLMIHILTLS